MTDIVTFSGWGQAYDALDNIAPGARHIDYAGFQDISELYAHLDGTTCDVAIGWSLGGQLALRAIDEGALSAKLLVLIATPFQFVESPEVKCGMPENIYEGIRQDFENDPEKMLRGLSALIARNDSREKDILRQLKPSTQPSFNWLYWLDELENFSGNTLNFDNEPRTMMIHGREDTVVDVTQSSLFIPFFPGHHTEIIDRCGHAPHLHDEGRVKQLIQDAL